MTRDLAATLSSPALKAEEARLARFFKSINKHRTALDFAVDESFGGSAIRRSQFWAILERVRKRQASAAQPCRSLERSRPRSAWDPVSAGPPPWAPWRALG